MTTLLLVLLSVAALTLEAAPASAKPARTAQTDDRRDAAELESALLEVYARYQIPPGTTICGAMTYFAYYEDWRRFLSEVLEVYRQYHRDDLSGQ
jgi:hypothetical protein